MKTTEPISRTKVPSSQRAHAVGGVEDGGRVVASPAAGVNARSGAPKRTQIAYAPHPSTTAAQRQPGGRGDSTRNVAPRQPVVANPSTSRRFATPAVTPGMRSQRGAHDPVLGDRVLDEAAGQTLTRHHSVAGRIPTAESDLS